MVSNTFSVVDSIVLNAVTPALFIKTSTSQIVRFLLYVRTIDFVSITSQEMIGHSTKLANFFNFQ